MLVGSIFDFEEETPYTDVPVGYILFIPTGNANASNIRSLELVYLRAAELANKYPALPFDEHMIWRRFGKSCRAKRLLACHQRTKKNFSHPQPNQVPLAAALCEARGIFLAFTPSTFLKEPRQSYYRE